MKKAFSLFLLILLTCSAFALELDFEMVPKDGPLFRESVSDPYSFISRIHIQKDTDPDCRPTKIRSAVKVYRDGVQQDTRYFDLPYSYSVVEDPDRFSTYLSMRMGLSASILRLRLDDEKIPSIDFEVTLAGALNTLFNVFSNSTCLGFDGTWMIGGNVRVADFVTFRAGMHHFSGHYGDETLDDFYRTNQIDFNDNARIGADFEGRDSAYDYYLNNLMEYVRDNYWIVGTSVDTRCGFRVYGELEWPFKGVWLRPFASTPCGHETQDGVSLIDYIGTNSEGFTQEQVQREKELKTGTGYNALRCHMGFEYRYELGSAGTLFLSADLQLHQDGQTLHDVNTYSPDNPWEKELSLVVGIELGDLVPGKNLRVELGLHDGRVSTTDWFYQRSRTVSIGMSIS